MRGKNAGHAKLRGKRSAGEETIASLNQAGRWARGKKVPVRITTVAIPDVDVRGLRRRLKLSQTQFAARFGFAPASLQNWEQGRSRPGRHARVLLAVIAKHPEAVQDALHH